jgi:hypothetical protein
VHDSCEGKKTSVMLAFLAFSASRYIDRHMHAHVRHMHAHVMNQAVSGTKISLSLSRSLSLSLSLALARSLSRPRSPARSLSLSLSPPPSLPFTLSPSHARARALARSLSPYIRQSLVPNGALHAATELPSGELLHLFSTHLQCTSSPPEVCVCVCVCVCVYVCV